MEQQQRSLVFTAAVGLIILAIIVGSIYYLVKFIQGRVASNSMTPQASVTELADDFAATPSASFSPSEFGSTAPQISPNQINVPETGGNPPSDEQSSPAGKKVYNGGDFQLTYPNTWGIAACSNSQNFEFDPTTAGETSMVCDTATKPVTILVGDTSGCGGESTKVGSIDVTKSQVSEGGYTKYQWCTKTTPVLNITHRVSQGNEPATSKQDFVRQIEEMISNLSFSRGS